MSERIFEQPHRVRILSAFLIGGIVGGLIFAWCVTRTSLHDTWFRFQEFWVFPTRRLSLLATAIFLLSLAIPYYIAHRRNWLSFPARRLVMALALFALLPISFWLLEPLSILAQVLLFRIALAGILTLTLFVVTRRWYTGLAIVILLVSLTFSIIAGIPYGFFRSATPEWYEASKYFVASALLASVFGWWLAAASRPASPVGVA